jgi:hypothetical protein
VWFFQTKNKCKLPLHLKRVGGKCLYTYMGNPFVIHVSIITLWPTNVQFIICSVLYVKLMFTDKVVLEMWDLTCVLITNLTCNKLIMKILWSSFIHMFIHFTHEYYALKTHLTHEYMCWQMKYESMNEQLTHKFHIFS